MVRLKVRNVTGAVIGAALAVFKAEKVENTLSWSTSLWSSFGLYDKRVASWDERTSNSKA